MSNQQDALESFRLEYEQLVESYRHTYETIWNAGAVFTAISAGMVVFGVRGQEELLHVSTLTKWLWPLPFFFWWLGIFTPMDRYGKLRFERLRELENETVDWSHPIRHFLYMDSPLENPRKLIRLKGVHVGYTVDLFGLLLFLIWLLMLLEIL